MSYKFLEHTADVMFKVNGENLNELFKDVAMALFETMVNVDTVNDKVTREIHLANEDVQGLLFDFLEEIVFMKDAEYMVFKDLTISVDDGKLQATLFGDLIDQKTQELKNDIKAITLHEFYVKKVSEGWEAQVIVDI